MFERVHVLRYGHSELVFIFLEDLHIEPGSYLPYQIMRVEQVRRPLGQFSEVLGVTGRDDVTVVSAVDGVEPEALEQTVAVIALYQIKRVAHAVGQVVAVLLRGRGIEGESTLHSQTDDKQQEGRHRGLRAARPILTGRTY